MRAIAACTAPGSLEADANPGTSVGAVHTDARLRHARFAKAFRFGARRGNKGQCRQKQACGHEDGTHARGWGLHNLDLACTVPHYRKPTRGQVFPRGIEPIKWHRRRRLVVSWEAWTVLGILALVLYLFVREVVPIPVTAMLAAALLLVTGILEPVEGLSGFSSPATVTVLAMFVLSAGIERSGVVAWLSAALQKWAGSSMRKQLAALWFAGPVSGFVNNTPVVALLIPTAANMARQSGRRPSQLLMPLSFFAMLGGTLTLIGTSTNLLGNDLLPRLGVEPFHFFDFLPIGLTALAVALVYFLTVGMRLLPARGDKDVVDRFDLKGFVAEFEVPPPSDDAKGPTDKTLNDLGLVRGKGAQVLRIYRGSRSIPGPRGDTALVAGDVLMVQASRERLEELPERTGLASLAEARHGITEGDDLATAELVIAPGRLEGRSVQDVRFAAEYGVLVLAIRHRNRVAIGPLARTRLAAGDVLLVQGPTSALDRLEETSSFFLTRERPIASFRRDRALLAVGILAAVVALAALSIMPIVAAALAGAVAMVLTRCLRIEEFLDAVHWDIVLLLAGIIPLGLAVEKTGLATILASGLGGLGVHLDPFWFLLAVFVVTSLVTEVVSNNASVVLMIPIVVGAAAGLGLDPRPFALAVIVSASTSMLTPVGYQTNTMVYAPGQYRFTDYVRVGGPLNAVLALSLCWVIARVFPM